MKVRIGCQVYKVVDTKKSLGVQWYCIEDEPNHYDWVHSVEEVLEEDTDIEAKPLYQRAKITWIDSMTGLSTWQLLEDFKDDKPLVVETLGFIICKDDEHVTIAQSLALNPDQICNTMSIPKVAIKSVDYIEN